MGKSNDINITTHLIPMNKLKTIEIVADGTKRSLQSSIKINGLKVGKWIKEVKFEGEAMERPKVILIGKLERLTEEEKQSWGLLETEKVPENMFKNFYNKLKNGIDTFY